MTYNTGKKEVLKFEDDLLKEYGVSVLALKCDSKIEEDIINIKHILEQKNIVIDILINNAATSHDSYFLEKTKTEFMDVLEVNVVGTFLIIKHLNHLINKGYIFNIASSDGIDTYNEISIDYSASKAAIINLTKSLALSLPSLKIYCISPNWIDTNTTRNMNLDYLNDELKRTGQSRLIHPDELSNLIYTIVNGKYRTGTNFRVDIKNNNIVVEELI